MATEEIILSVTKHYAIRTITVFQIQESELNELRICMSPTARRIAKRILDESEMDGDKTND